MTSTSTKTSTTTGGQTGSSGLPLRIAVAWTVVGVPLAYGVLKTVQKAAPLFG